MGPFGGGTETGWFIIGCIGAAIEFLLQNPWIIMALIIFLIVSVIKAWFPTS